MSKNEIIVIGDAFPDKYFITVYESLAKRYSTYANEEEYAKIKKVCIAKDYPYTVSDVSQNK